jgi:anaerobic magnesium-protoporphyrin IX monomethyl ester cyclase
MKVCLVRPPIALPASNIAATLTPPLGLAYVGAALCDAGHEVSIIDATGDSPDTRHAIDDDTYVIGLTLDETVARIPLNTDIVGFSCGFSFEWPIYRQIIADVRTLLPNAFLIAGGEHVTAVPEQSLTASELDAVVMGEGEETAIALVNSLANGDRDLAAIDGIAFKISGGGVKINPRRGRSLVIDDFPAPAWDLLPIENYLSRGLGFGVDRGRSMPLLASRGCPYQCAFCSSPVMWTTKWLARDQDLLLDEIEDYQRRYGAMNFDFYDLTAIVKKSWIIEFCHKIEERGLSFTWQLPSGTRSEAIDQEVAEALYRSGCRNISYSPESGSEEVLRRIKKKVKPAAMLGSVSSCVAAGLNVKFNIIFGFPGETFRHVLQSMGFIVRMALHGAHDISIWCFSPYPGSELFAELSDRGELGWNDAYFNSLRAYADFSQAHSYSEHLSDRQVKVLRIVGMSLFYLTSWIRFPTRPFRMIGNLATGRQESRAEMALVNMIRFRRS